MWFDESTGQLLGNILGAIGAVWGTSFGLVAGLSRGRWRGLVLGMMKFAMIWGALLLFTSGAAFFDEQPRHVWWPFLICGIISVAIACYVYPFIKRAYRMQDLKKMRIEDM